MTPMHSPDQPDRSARPAAQAGRRITIPVSHEMLLKMRSENAVAVRESDWQRFVRKVRDLDDRSDKYLAAGWALTGIAATVWVGALTIPADDYLFQFAIVLTLFALGGFKANRDVNNRQEDRAEELASEMEHAADLDNLPVAPEGGPSR